MTGTPLAQARRLARAERRWLTDARDRLRRSRTATGADKRSSGGPR